MRISEDRHGVHGRLPRMGGMLGELNSDDELSWVAAPILNKNLPYFNQTRTSEYVSGAGRASEALRFTVKIGGERMKNSGKISALLFVFFILVMSVGCSTTKNAPDLQNSGLQINYMNTAIGAVEGNYDNHDIQRFSYSIALSNNDKDDVFIKEITLVLPPEFEKILINKQLTVQVNKTIDTNSSIDVKGDLEFNAASMTKEDIVKLNPSIKLVKVVSEKTISLYKWAK